MLEEIRGYIAPLVTRWSLKALGGILVGIGIDGGHVAGFLTSAESVMVGVITFLVGLVISLFNHKKAINQPPPIK